MEEKAAVSVIKNNGFFNLWINQILIQLCYNSLNFALIIWVFHLTKSSLAVSALLFSVYFPVVLFSLFSGVVVDITDRKKIILAIDVCLTILYLLLILFKDSYLAILFITFMASLLAQFYSPAEASAIPLIVRKDQLLAANSLFSTTMNMCFLLGAGLAGALIDTFGIDIVFIIGALFSAIASSLAIFFPSIRNKADTEGVKLQLALSQRNFSLIKSIGLAEIHNTFALVKGKILLFFAIAILASVQVFIAILAVLMPSFFEDFLHIQASQISYVVVLPLGLGMVLGGLLMGRLGHRVPKRLLIARSVLVTGLAFFLIGMAPILTPVIRYFPKHRPLPFTYQIPLSAILASGAILFGMMFVSILVSAQTALQENSPEEDRGKIFALLGFVTGALSIIPVIFAGVLSDLFGSQIIFIILGIMITLLGLFGLRPNIFFKEHHLSFSVREFLGLGHWEKKE